MRLLFLLLLLIPVLLHAQSAPPLPLEGVGGSVPISPPQNLIGMAYGNMLAGNYAKAEAQYRKLSKLEPDNLTAWEGLMWAQNMQSEYRATLKLARQLDKQQMMQKALLNYKAYALLSLKRYPEARYNYQKAYQGDPGNPLANQISQEGLAYAYLGMGDYPRYQNHLYAASAISGIPAKNAKPGFHTTFYYCQPGEYKQSWGLIQGIYYRSWMLSLAYEDFSIDSKPFRSIAKAEVGKQFFYVDAKLSARAMEGEDERVYPAKQLGLELTPKIYASGYAFQPAVFASYSKYPRFSVQQLSAKPNLLFRDMSLEYCLHYRYLDNEPAGTDSSIISQQVQFAKELPWGLRLGLRYGSGNDTWSVDGSGSVIDTFNQAGSYYGVSLYYPLSKRFSLFAYNQVCKNDKLWYFSLTGSY